FKNDSDIILLSHTVDPANDTIEALLAYAEQHKAIRNKWHFLTGDRAHIYSVCQTGYFMVAEEAQTGPDAFIHSNQFSLIDKEGRIRGIYDGTDIYEVKKLIEDIKVLKYEYTKKVQR
ncbi:MAG TPA: SCO family protein, partial [Bacteroidia bacterium]|nr:SCO family protein [Bacteroidia bacterium]